MTTLEIPLNEQQQSIDAGVCASETQSIRVVDRAGRPALTLNVDDYRQYVEALDLSEEQEQELLQTLWTIIVSFVDLGFGIESVQQAINKPSSNETRSKVREEGLHHEYS